MSSLQNEPREPGITDFPASTQGDAARGFAGRREACEAGWAGGGTGGDGGVGEGVWLAGRLVGEAMGRYECSFERSWKRGGGGVDDRVRVFLLLFLSGSWVWLS